MKKLLFLCSLFFIPQAVHAKDLGVTVDSFMNEYHNSVIRTKDDLENHDRLCASLVTSDIKDDVDNRKEKIFSIGNAGPVQDCGDGVYLLIKDENLDNIIDWAGVLYPDKKSGLPLYVIIARSYFLIAMIGADNYKNKSISDVMSVPGTRNEGERLIFIDEYKISNKQVNDSNQFLSVSRP